MVLVHGWGSRAGRFSGMARALAGSGFRVVAYDAPAHGRSTGRLASLPEFARALARGGTHRRSGARDRGPLARRRRGDARAPGRAQRGADRAAGGAGGRDPILDRVRGSSSAAAGDPGRAAAEPRDPAQGPVGRAAPADDRALAPRAGARCCTIATTRTCRSATPKRSRAPGRAPGWCLTDGLGHRAILRDPAVVRRAVTRSSRGRRKRDRDGPGEHDGAGVVARPVHHQRP